MKRNNHVTIEEILDAIMQQESNSSHTALVKWCKEYPEFRQEIADFFATWATESEAVDRCEIDKKLVANRMVSYAMNLLHHRPAESVAPEGEQARLYKLIEASGKTEDALMEECDLDDSLLSKLDRRLIEFATIPRRCIQKVSRALDVGYELVACSFNGTPVPLGAYKSKGKPVSEQESFLIAVAASDLSEEKKNEWVKIVKDEKPE